MIEYKVVTINVLWSTGKSAEKKIQDTIDMYAKKGYVLDVLHAYDMSSKILLVFKKEGI